MGMEGTLNEHLRTKLSFTLDSRYIFHNMRPMALGRTSRRERIIRRVSIAFSAGLLALTAIMLAQHHR
jgi:hypothetical protein